MLSLFLYFLLSITPSDVYIQFLQSLYPLMHCSNPSAIILYCTCHLNFCFRAARYHLDPQCVGPTQNNYVHSNLAALRLLSCAYCHPLWHDCKVEGIEEMTRCGELADLLQKGVVRGSLLCPPWPIMAALVIVS